MLRVNPCGMFLNPQYLIFKMYADYSGPTLLKSDVACDTYPAPEYEAGRPQAIGRIPYLDASATLSADGKTLYLAVINRHIAQSIKTKIVLDKWNFLSEVKFAEFYDDDYMAENTFENPNRLAIKEAELTGLANPFTYVFKPHSVTIFELKRK
jgi:alpha-N-arabinofuranosidase